MVADQSVAWDQTKDKIQSRDPHGRSLFRASLCQLVGSGARPAGRAGVRIPTQGLAGQGRGRVGNTKMNRLGCVTEVSDRPRPAMFP